MLRERSSGRDAWIPRVVWSVWAALTIAAVGLILALGVDVPYLDEWGDVVPFYAGARQVDAASLWRAHNEHRIPIPRSILIGLDRVTNHDFRAGALLSVAALSAASALLLRRARDVDGRLRLADCALPLALLHWGHYMTLLWSYQVHAALLVLLASALLALVLRHPDSPPLRVVVLYGVCLLAMPLCDAGGVALAPVMSLWCVAVGVRDVRSREASRRLPGWLALALAPAVVALAAVAFVPHRGPTVRNPLDVAWWSEVVLSTGFGVTDRKSFLLTVLLPAATAALLLATGVRLVRVARAQPRERLRAFGLGLFLLAFQGLALGIGWARPDWALSERYPTLAAPLLCGIFLVWRRYAPGHAGAGVCAALCAVLVLLLPWNTATGLRFARGHAKTAAAFERDVRGGMSVGELASRYVDQLHPSIVTFRKGLRCMRDAEIGAFRPHAGESR